MQTFWRNYYKNKSHDYYRVNVNPYRRDYLDNLGQSQLKNNPIVFFNNNKNLNLIDFIKREKKKYFNYNKSINILLYVDMLKKEVEEHEEILIIKNICNSFT